MSYKNYVSTVEARLVWERREVLTGRNKVKGGKVEVGSKFKNKPASTNDN